MGDETAMKPPQRTTGDVAHAAAKAVLGSLPIAGASAAELFQLLVQPPLERRRDHWMNEVAVRIRELEKHHGVSIEDLQENEAFMDTVLQATVIAARNSQQEKLEALRNAVANAALPHAPDESEQQMFLQLVDQSTVWHLRTLSLFDDPRAWFKAQHKQPRDRYMSSLSSILVEAFPEMEGQREFYDQVWRDLRAAGLVNTEGLHTMMSGDGTVESRTTPRGKAFLRFVREPADSAQQVD